MNQNLYKKTGWVIAQLARELLTSAVGDRCPTIASCVERFGVSRGTVQDAFATLEQEGCLVCSAHGSKGSFIERIDKRKLYRYTELDALSASMPVPLNDPLGGLATAVCRCMNDCPIPFTFAFIEGAGKRVNALLRMNYDFIVVSAMTAHQYMPSHPELEIAMTLTHCVYSPEYVLCINKKEAVGLEDGMTVGLDPNCTDQVTLFQRLAAGHDVTVKEIPYMSCKAALLEYEVDAIIYRKEPWVLELGSITWLPVEDEVCRQVDMNTPVILTNSNNFGIARILQCYLHEEKMHDVQQLVLNKSMRPQYY